MPAGATGAFLFGPVQKPFGTVLVENGRVCWAGAAQLGSRLSDLLRSRLSPSADALALEEIVRRCQKTATPLGEALVGSGLMTGDQFREALYKHTSEALLMLTQSETGSPTWHAHRKQRYDARFTFSPSEILTGVGACVAPARASEAHHELSRHLKTEGCGIAFAHYAPAEDGTPDGSEIFPVAEKRGTAFSTAEMQHLGAWGWGALQKTPRASDNSPWLFALRGAAGDSLVTWRTRELMYVVICPSSSSFAFIVGRLARTSPSDRSGSS